MSATLFDVPVKKSASISECGRHRLTLTRIWDEANPKRMVLCGLNPSTADAEVDDPTIRRDIGFAKREGCGGLFKINIGTLRETDPDNFFAAHVMDRNHPNARLAWKWACLRENRIVVACWGSDKRAKKMAEEFIDFAREHNVELWCLGLSKDGSPRHPLYLRADTPLQIFGAGS